MLLLSTPCAASRLNEPLAVTPPVVPSALAFRRSENPSASTSFLIDSAWVRHRRADPHVAEVHRLRRLDHRIG